VKEEEYSMTVTNAEGHEAENHNIFIILSTTLEVIFHMSDHKSIPTAPFLWTGVLRGDWSFCERF
jgi:hypothetical protein